MGATSKFDIIQILKESEVRRMKRTKEEYMGVRNEARLRFSRFMDRVRENPRALDGDERILIEIARDLGIDKDILISYVRDLLDKTNFVDYQGGVWTDEKGEVYINPPHLARIVGYTREQIYYYLRTNSWEPLQLLTNLPYNRVQKYYKLKEVCPQYCFLRYKHPDMPFKQFLVFFAMIAWRESFNCWPTNVQVQKTLEKRHNFSLWSINGLASDLQKNGFITIIHPNGSYRGPKEVIINKGLERLPVTGALRANNSLLRKLHGIGG
ncbi:hypothetical protein C4544_05745 [candidate division WS5 bacterium]|uniref:Uncharacterized protein n=1 Tax=candidate division WS5 bacterium TaxID=2093353 RepID=A0A419DAX3_9BACT|nr:MAG: hypothetical protein C4544_05745 [candidate division WS5 bacterium]